MSTTRTQCMPSSTTTVRMSIRPTTLRSPGNAVSTSLTRDFANRIESVTSIDELDREVTDCGECPRLREWCTRVAHEKRAAYRDEVYWGGPVPGFGSRQPRIWIVGLAPGAHGANRTGRCSPEIAAETAVCLLAQNRPGTSQPRRMRRRTAPGRGSHHRGRALRTTRQQANNRGEAHLPSVAAARSRTTTSTFAPYARWHCRQATSTYSPTPVARSLVPAQPSVTARPFRLPIRQRSGSSAATTSQQNTFTGRLTEDMLDGVFIGSTLP